MAVLRTTEFGIKLTRRDAQELKSRRLHNIGLCEHPMLPIASSYLYVHGLISGIIPQLPLDPPSPILS